MDVASPTQASRGVTLDTPPPRPGNLMSVQRPQNEGLGDLANSPQILAMQGMAMIKEGVEQLCSGLPMLQPMLMDAVQTLEQLVVQGMTGALSGQQSAAPPGVAPMMQPPPGTAAPTPAGVPGMSGTGGPPSPMAAA